MVPSAFGAGLGEARVFPQCGHQMWQHRGGSLAARSARAAAQCKISSAERRSWWADASPPALVMNKTKARVVTGRPEDLRRPSGPHTVNTVPSDTAVMWRIRRKGTAPARRDIGAANSNVAGRSRVAGDHELSSSR